MSVGAKVIELRKDICASLWMAPANFDDLVARDFLHNRSHEGIDRMLLRLETDKWIYQRGEVYFTYKQTVLNELQEYDLYVGEKDI